MIALNSDNLLNGLSNYLITPNKYQGFLLRYSGTAQAGQTPTLANCGNVILNIGGKDKINVDVEMLSFANNLYFGAVEASAVAGGAFAFSIWIQAGAWFDPANTFVLTQGMQSNFKLDFPAMTAALIASGTVKYSAVLQNGQQSYWHTIYNFNVVAQGAGIITNTIAKQNISTLYLKNPAALVGQTQINKDNTTYINNNIADELAYSNLIHQIETAGTFFAYEFCPAKYIGQSISNNLTYQYNFSGAGTLAQYYSAFELIGK